MRPPRILAIGALIVAGLVPTLAAAQTGGGSFDGSGTIGAGVSVPGGTGSGGPGYVPVGSGGSHSGGGGSAPSAVWVRHYYGSDPSAGYGLNAPFYCAPPGAAYQDVLVDNATGATLDTVSGCSTVGQPGGSTPTTTPQPPPTPPTPEEAFNLVSTPLPVMGLSPVGSGLTGLETELWDDNGAAPRTATATIRGYVTTTTARPVRWTWNMTEAGPASRSNPYGIVTATRPGTAESPAGRYTYETSGTYTVSLVVQWSGSYTFVGAGGVSLTRSLGTRDRSTSRSYSVEQIRPVLVSR